jgi:transcriptional regulator GlxA family with amidase domain
MAEEAGISTRSLAEAFGELTGVTPTDFLRDVRLSRAHDDLLAADPDAVTVPATALRWGFADLPHFAALYGQRYGTGPIEALRTG